MDASRVGRLGPLLAALGTALLTSAVAVTVNVATAGGAPSWAWPAVLVLTLASGVVAHLANGRRVRPNPRSTEIHLSARATGGSEIRQVGEGRLDGPVERRPRRRRTQLDDR